MSDRFTTRTLGDIARLFMGETIISADCSGHGIPVFSSDTSEAPWNYSDHPRLRLRRGAIIVGARGTIGRPRLPNFDTYSATQTTIVVEPKREIIEPRFLWHLLRTIDFSRLGAQQAIPMVTVAELATLKLRLPKRSVQKVCIVVLDTVDEAIAKMEAVIEKLRKVRAGLLHDLLTRGLDEDGQLRDPIAHPEQFRTSPVGPIPKEWTAKSLRQLTEFISYGFTNPMPTTSDGPWMLTAFDIGDGEVKFGGARHTTQNAFDTRLSSKSKPAVGDILVTKDGTLGRVALVDRPGVCINQSVAVLRPWAETDASFVMQYLRSPAGQRSMLEGAGGSTIKHIYITKLGEVIVPYPAAEERRQIARKLSDYELLIQEEEFALEKFQRLKSGLMTDLLTGRVRVPVED